jgi:hypothetical protein
MKSVCTCQPRSWLESAHEWVEAFSNARLVVLEGAGHKPYLERPEELVGAIEKFLRRMIRPVKIEFLRFEDPRLHERVRVCA